MGYCKNLEIPELFKSWYNKILKELRDSQNQIDTELKVAWIIHEKVRPESYGQH